jgi:hypothetical protein
MRSVLVAAAVAALALTGTGAASAAPAKSHSVDIGLTIQDGNAVQGSGSYTNTDGTYDNVCVVVEKRTGASWNVVGGSRVCDESPAGSRAFSTKPITGQTGSVYRTEIIATPGLLNRKASNELTVH